jgi:hydroxysqualene synthase
MKFDTIQRSVKSCTPDEAFEYCANVTAAHYENFPVVSLFLPEEKRPYIQAVYAFSRAADDFADEDKLAPEERLAKLNDWGEKLRVCYEGIAEHPVFVALGETIRRLNIPIDPFRDLLTAFQQDVTQNRYRTFNDLLDYCRCSANPVGRLVLMIFGQRDDRLFSLSDHICTALQLTNLWQDIDIDRQKDRLYIPLEDMERFGYSETNWKNGVVNRTYRELMKFEVERTRALFHRGAELPSIVEKELQIELKLVWFGGMAVLKKLERIQYDVFHRRPILGKIDKFMILIRGLFHNDLIHYGEKRKPWDLT